jgi:exodeoxyribonuclease VII large subunit
VQGIQRDLTTRKTLLSHIAARVVSPRDRLREQAQRTDELSMRLERAFKVRLERRHASLEQLMGKLDALSPLRVLERGYAIAQDEDGTIIRSKDSIKPGQDLQIRLTDGVAKVRAT